MKWGKQPLHTELSAVTFAGSSQKDSLKEDNCAYALKDQVSTSKATLIGEGNTYIEKAYLAVTGENLSKAKQRMHLTVTIRGFVFLMRMRQCRNLISRRRG